MGPSLKSSEIDYIKNNKTEEFIIIGCNDSYKYIDYLDIHYACDTGWWKKWGEDFRSKRPNLESWTQCESSAKNYNINHIKGRGGTGLSLNSDIIHYGSNSGFQQLNLAFLMGFKRFYLVGYTMKVISGKTHYFGDHPAGLQKNSPYDKFVQAFNNIQKQIKPLIYSSTENSQLNNIFKYKSVEDIFND